jgi:NAD(P) transhydrogenase subunit alpha
VKLAVPTETRPGERRVALVPDVVKKLVASGWEVSIQAGAGVAAAFPDAAYTEAGATIAPDAAAVQAGAGLVVRVNAPSAEDAAHLPQGGVVLSFFQAGQSADALKALAGKGATVFSFDLLPRISRAQSMDALSSQATVSGYRAGLAAAEHLAKFFPMFMTAAGTVPPAKVLVMGVGVAGLQSIATARRLGAVVKA